MMDMAADFRSMTKDFGMVATIGAASVRGIFDDAYQTTSNGFIESSAPQFQCATADVASVVQGQTITVNAKNYLVTTVQPDGTGVTTLILELA
jgi:endonuclease YncB( thermonuclease family)